MWAKSAQINRDNHKTNLAVFPGVIYKHTCCGYPRCMSQEVSISRSDVLGGFDVLESHVRKFEYAPHRHSEVVIAVYTAGAKIATCDNQRFVVQAGDILVIGPETLHKAKTLKHQGWRYQSVYLAPQQIADATGYSLQDVESRVTGHRLHQGVEVLGRQLKHALEDSSHQPLALSDFLIKLLRISNKKEVQTTAVSASIKSVHDRLADDPASATTLIKLAGLADLTPEHLSRQFKVAYGLSPFQFLTTSRVRLAKERIACGSSISDAAYAAGFADQSHLTRWFNRIYGLPPGAFARSQIRSRQA